MIWTRRFGIICSIGVILLGILAGYQALLMVAPPAANAGQVPPTQPEETPEPPVPQTPSTPPIKLPAMVQSSELIVPSPLPSLQPPPPTGAIVPVAAQDDPALVVVPSPTLPQTGVTTSTTGALNSAPCLWNLAVNIVAGRTHLTAQIGKDVKLAVSCDVLDVQTPRGRISAAGKVKVTSDHFEGTCERLTISWQEDVVVLQKVQLKCKLEGQAADLYAEELRLRLQRVQPSAAASDWWDWSFTK
jgi:hypothetical protein